jgi:hypothetical protein
MLAAAAACALAAAAPLAVAQTVPVPVQAPHYGDTLFNFFQDKHFEAITGLMVSQHFGRVAPHDDEAEVLRGGMLLSYGLHNEASTIFTQLIEHNAAPAVRDRAWFFLARLRYQRGLYTAADEALARVANPLPGPLQEERLLLQAQLRMAQGDFAAAAAVLQTVPPQAAAASFARFNLGVSLVKTGDAERGNALLDQIGLAPAADEEQRALRDRANVALGFAALAGRQPERARTVLQRVRLVGPQSNKALLGFGWAAAELKAPKDALVPWTELAGRDTADAAVLEAKIALPYAYAELGALRQSLDRYNDAITLYGAERQRLQESITAIRAGGLVAALLQGNPNGGMSAFAGIGQVPQGPQMPHAAHLWPLMAGHAFQEAFKNLRDLQFLARNLQDWNDRLGTFNDMLGLRRDAFAQRLPAVRSSAGALNLPVLQQRRDALAAELAQAESQADERAFADSRELGLIERLQRVEAALQQTADAELGERLRRVKGALTWQLARDYPVRLWDARKGQRATDAALAAARERDAALTRAQQAEPARFEAFAARIAALDARLQALSPRVAELGREQQDALQDLAVAELQQQQERLDIYAAQARLAVAQLYDRAQLAQRSERSERSENTKAGDAKP